MENAETVLVESTADTIVRDLAFTLAPIIIIIVVIAALVRASRANSDQKIKDLEDRVNSLEKKGKE